MPHLKVIVPNRERYEIYNALQLESKVSKTVEKSVVVRPGPIKRIPSKPDLPTGTVAELITYKIELNGYIIAKVHQYWLPDGSVRGGPDPVFMNLDDIVVCRQQDYPPE